MCFVNFSNHSLNSWGEQQKQEAQKWGRIIDVPFPAVNPEDTNQEIIELAQNCVKKILEYHPTAVMCQGEFTLSYHVIRLLKERNVTVVSACSERKVVDEKNESGVVYKKSVFKFVQFREY